MDMIAATTDPISFFLAGINKKNGGTTWWYVQITDCRAVTEVFHQRISPNPDGVHVAACDECVVFILNFQRNCFSLRTSELCSHRTESDEKPWALDVDRRRVMDCASMAAASGCQRAYILIACSSTA